MNVLALLFVASLAWAGPRLSFTTGNAMIVSPDTIKELKQSHHTTLEAVPLGNERVNLTLSEFDPFEPDAKILDGDKELPKPSSKHFKGNIEGDPDSLVVVTVSDDHIRGFVSRRGEIYHLSPEPGKVKGQLLLSPHTPRLKGLDTREVPHRGLVRYRRSSTLLVTLPIAVESDYELTQKLGGATQAVDYLTSLWAAVSVIYQRNVSTPVTIASIHVWSTPADPWNATGIDNILDETQAYWRSHYTNVTRAAVMMIAAKEVTGGLAYVDALCDNNYGFGVAEVEGAFDLSSPSRIWDVLVAAHELGHLVASPHTHCYSPPVDMCYNREGGCYSGPVIASRGTIMSYCHLLNGGLSNIDLQFGGVVNGRLLDGLGRADCLPLQATTTTVSNTTSTSLRPTTTNVSSTSLQPTTTVVTSTTRTTVTPTTLPPKCSPRGVRCGIGRECCTGCCAFRPRFGYSTCRLKKYCK